jgi:glutamate N-acetyltransferase/amino-acid N-acetyltransferase
VAGVFTTNKIQGATVRLCRQRLAGRTARAIVINSGNANACNGPHGPEAAERMAAAVAVSVGVDAQAVFVCSTGVIGVRLPVEKAEAGIRAAAAALSREGGQNVIRAIMTTDTFPKEAAVRLTVGGKPVTVAGIAKGAGMIEPNMATMLSFLTTDAAVRPEALQACLNSAVKASYNRITVDGDQSCNDTVLLLANGAAGGAALDERHPDWPRFQEAVHGVTLSLAKKIVRDGEGATKFVTVVVKGAASDADAALATRAIANSLLVKTSWFGQDPNWGRVIDAVGYSGAQVREESVDIAFDEVLAVRGGQVAPGDTLPALRAVLARKEFGVTVDLRLGAGQDTVYTCDCTVEYVKINSDYTT